MSEAGRPQQTGHTGDESESNTADAKPYTLAQTPVLRSVACSTELIARTAPRNCIDGPDDLI